MWFSTLRPKALIVVLLVMLGVSTLDNPLGHAGRVLLPLYLTGIVILLLIKLIEQLWNDRYWLLDAVRGRPVNVRQARLRALFDSYASRFDKELAEDLAYRGPQIADALLANNSRPDERLDILDLGCGTGLAAAMLRPRAKHLVGCDLSANMLDKARDRGLYDSLHHMDMMTFLDDHTDRFDLIIALDTLIYVDDPWRFYRLAHQTCRAGGSLLATTELATTAPIETVRGRRRESREVTLSLAAAAGFELLDERQEILRLEGGKPVAAGVYFWRRS